jgi:hypothetical protein
LLPSLTLDTYDVSPQLRLGRVEATLEARLNQRKVNRVGNHLIVPRDERRIDGLPEGPRKALALQVVDQRAHRLEH